MRHVASGRGSETGRETGQVLIMFALLMVVLIGFVSLAIDVGVFLHEKGRVQAIVDSAALAGAYDLPDDGANAASNAYAYAAANDSGFSPATIDVTFRCIVGDRNGDGLPDASDIPAVCDPGPGASFACTGLTCVSPCNFNQPNNKCNTIVVSGNKDVPFYFAPVLSIMGGPSKCFFS